MAIVPGVTVRQELRDGKLVRIPLRELYIPRRTLMVYSEEGYVSDSARELIKIVRAFNWELADPRPARVRLGLSNDPEVAERTSTLDAVAERTSNFDAVAEPTSSYGESASRAAKHSDAAPRANRRHLRGVPGLER